MSGIQKRRSRHLVETSSGRLGLVPNRWVVKGGQATRTKKKVPEEHTREVRTKRGARKIKRYRAPKPYRRLSWRDTLRSNYQQRQLALGKVLYWTLMRSSSGESFRTNDDPHIPFRDRP